MNHSNVVGGSTAKRVINCPASVKLVQQMPPKPSSEHADRGTLLHDVISELLEFDKAPEQCLGAAYKGQVLTQELLDEKITPALQALDEIDPDKQMEYMVETRVGFGDFLPGVFGSADLLGRLGDRAVVLDWKFGDGVAVDAEENPQLLFYAAAAMRTEACKWVFEGATEIELIIVQPPVIRRWVTDKKRVAAFERELAQAVKRAHQDDAPFAVGEHCRWCAAKPVCPQMTGAVERALKQQLTSLPAEQIAMQLRQADVIEEYIKDLRALAFRMLESNVPVPGYKLVAKQSRRQWVDEVKTRDYLLSQLVEPYKELEVISPAQAEKALKKIGKELPSELVVSVSSGSTLAEDSDPRPAVLNLGNALARLNLQ